jgi:hypothetical protein
VCYSSRSNARGYQIVFLETGPVNAKLAKSLIPSSSSLLMLIRSIESEVNFFRTYTHNISLRVSRLQTSMQTKPKLRRNFVKLATTEKQFYSGHKREPCENCDAEGTREEEHLQTSRQHYECITIVAHPP